MDIVPNVRCSPRGQDVGPEVAGRDREFGIKHYIIEDDFEPGSGKYDGEFNDKGERQGQGTCTWEDGTSYDGHWLRHLRHGKGTLKMSNGSHYTGYFFNDKKHG